MTPEFRAWDKKNEIYLYNVQYAYDTLSGFVKYDDGKNATYDESCFGDFLDNKRYDTEQFTGLKDVNGNKIFEGDIVSYNLVREYGANYDPITLGFMGNDQDIDTELIGKVVVWPSQGVMVTNIRVTDPEQFDEKYPIPKRWHVNQQFEVIGNIHNNPELLEEDK